MYYTSSFFRLGVLQVIGFVIAFLALYVLLAAIKWKLFKKAGEPGWKSLIPFYNSYTQFKICWKTKWFWILLGSTVTVSLGMIIPLIGPILMVAACLVLLFISVFESLQLAKAFGKDEAYGIGLAFFGPVFEFILAFDKNVKYVGPQEDPQFFSNVRSDIQDEFNTYKPEPKQPERPMNFDPYTGKPIRKEAPVVQEVKEVKEAVKETVNEVMEDDDIQVIKPGELK